MIQTGPGMAYQPQPGYAPALPIPQLPLPTGAFPGIQPDRFVPTPGMPGPMPLPAPVGIAPHPSVPPAVPYPAPIPAPFPTAYPVQPMPPVPQGSLVDAFRAAAQRLWAHMQGAWPVSQPSVIPPQPPVLLPAPLPQPPVIVPPPPVVEPAPLPQPPVALPDDPVVPAPTPAPVADPAPAPKPQAKPQAKPEPKPEPKPKPKPKDPGTGPLMKFGAEGAPVKALQQRLRKLGVNPGTPDGDFGPKTEDAVKRFQRREGLAPTGVVNGKTWNELGIDVKGKVKYPAWGIKRAGSMAKIQGHRMTMATARAFSRMAKAAARDGITLRINSGYRSDAEQRVLFNAALKKYGSYAEASKWVAPPGTSTHRSGRSLDIENLAFAGAYNWLVKNGRKFGFVQTMSWEPWHWEFKG